MSALAGGQLQTLQGDVRTCGHLHTHKACTKTRMLKTHTRQTQISFEQGSTTLACEEAALNPAQGVPALHRKTKAQPLLPLLSPQSTPDLYTQLGHSCTPCSPTPGLTQDNSDVVTAFRITRASKTTHKPKSSSSLSVQPTPEETEHRPLTPVW